MKFFKPDSHSPVHIFGSFFLSHLLMMFLPCYWAVGIALGLGILYECWEELCWHKGWGKNWRYFGGVPMFDPRGGSIDDMVCDMIGCVLAIWV